MVCFVHDRSFRSKFHRTINILRQTNEFTILTLRQLPTRCCSCPERRKDTASTETEPLLTSLNIDVLRLICLRHDLSRYITTNVLPSSSKIHDYTILSFPTSFQSEERTTITNQFIMQQDDQLHSLQQMHHVDFEFVTSTASEQLLNEVGQLKYDLVDKCSNYLEATQAANGLWVIISIEDQTHIDSVKQALQEQWQQFIRNTNTYSASTVRNGCETLLSEVEMRYQQMLKKQKAKRQVMQLKITAKQHVMRILQARKKLWEEPKKPKYETDYLRFYASDDADRDAFYDAVDDFVECVVVDSSTRLQFLFNRYQNSNKCRRPRTHRRQHMLALAMFA